VAAVGGTIAVYAGGRLDIEAWPLMQKNAGYRFVLVYTMPPAAKRQAVADVSAAVEAGALRAGDDAGLPLHRYPLAETAAAHDAVQGGAVGKVLIDIA
jgi:NADPH2:quinone reductase